MDSQPTRQVCGVCLDEWLTEDEYNNHVCPKTGFAPTQPEHLINSTTPEFAAISQAALERGAADVAAPVTEQPTDTAVITGTADAAPAINLG